MGVITAALAYKYYHECPRCGEPAGHNGFHELIPKKTGGRIAKTGLAATAGALVGIMPESTVNNMERKYLVCERCGFIAEANGWHIVTEKGGWRRIKDYC